MLSAAVLRSTRPGPAMRSPRSATPTRRSTAGAARRSPTSSTSPRPSRARRAPCRRTPSPSTGAPTGGSSQVANASPRRSTPRHARCRRSSPSPRRATGAVTTRSSTRPTRDELALAGRGQCARSRRPGPSRWSEIGVLTRDNAHAAEVFDALTDAGVPVEIVGLNGLLRLPEVAEVVADPPPARRRHRQRRRCSPCSPVRAGPSARATSRCSAGGRAELAGARAGARPVAGSTSTPTSCDRGRHRPGRDPVPRRRARRPGRPAPYSAEALERFALLAARAAHACASHVGEPLLDLVRRIIDTTGVDVELASAVSAGRARPGATTSTCSSGRSPTSRPSTAT